MRITKLAIGTYNTTRNGAEYKALVVSGHVNGAEQAQALFSIVPWAVVGMVPRLGELRALLNGSSIEGVMGMSRAECLMNILPTIDESSVLLKLAVNDRAEYNRVTNMRGPEYRAAVHAMIQAEMAAALHGVTVRRASSAGNNGTLVDVDEVSDAGGVIGHVFPAVNAAAGKVQFKAQANGGGTVAWHEDFIGAVRALVTHSREVEGPKEEAYELRSKSPRENAQHAIDCALEQVSGADVGALLTLDYIGPDRGYLFIMQGPKDAQGVRAVTTLAAGCTSVERLMAHWAGFVDNLRPVVADVVRVGACMVIISGEAGKPVARGGLPAYPAKTDNEVLAKSLQIQRARQLGYTVHAPGAGETMWAFCIDGDYTDGFADGPGAWDGAIADMNAPRATKAAPGEMIYPATGPCAVGGAA